MPYNPENTSHPARHVFASQPCPPRGTSFLQEPARHSCCYRNTRAAITKVSAQFPSRASSLHCFHLQTCQSSAFSEPRASPPFGNGRSWGTGNMGLMQEMLLCIKLPERHFAGTQKYVSKPEFHPFNLESPNKRELR